MAVLNWFLMLILPPEVCLVGNDYSFALICKESTILHGHIWIYLIVTQSKIDELVQNRNENVV